MKMKPLKKSQACLAMACGLVTLIGSIPTSMAQTIYGFNERVLSVFDPETGLVTPIGSEPVATSLSLDDGPGGYLYGLRAVALRSYDPLTGEEIAAVAPDQPVNGGSLAISASGRFFLQSPVGPGDGRLAEIDPQTGAVTTIAPHSPTFPKMAGMAFGLDGTLYGVSSWGPRQLWVIDVETGVGTPVGDIGFHFIMADLSVSNDGVMFMTAGDNHEKFLFTLDPSTGAATLVTILPSGFYLTAMNCDIGPWNEPPTAVAGPDQGVHTGTLVQLDGSQSFDDNTEAGLLLYEWTIIAAPAGSQAALSDPFSQAPILVPDLPGDCVVQLIVTDEGGLASAADQVVVSSLNQKKTTQ